MDGAPSESSVNATVMDAAVEDDLFGSVLNIGPIGMDVEPAAIANEPIEASKNGGDAVVSHEPIVALNTASVSAAPTGTEAVLSEPIVTEPVTDSLLNAAETSGIPNDKPHVASGADESQKKIFEMQTRVPVTEIKDICFPSRDRSKASKIAYMASLGLTLPSAAKAIRERISSKAREIRRPAPVVAARGRARGGRSGRGRGRTPRNGYTTTHYSGASYANDLNGKHDDYCFECGKAGELLMCDTCTRVFHLGCCKPNLTEVPNGDWSCSYCKVELKSSADEDSQNTSEIGVFDPIRIEAEWITYDKQVSRNCQKLLGELRVLHEAESTCKEDKNACEKRILDMQSNIESLQNEKDLYRAKASRLRRAVREIISGSGAMYVDDAMEILPVEDRFRDKHKDDWIVADNQDDDLLIGEDILDEYVGNVNPGVPQAPQVSQDHGFIPPPPPKALIS